LTHNFVAESTGIDLRNVYDHQLLDSIVDALDEFAVLVFRNQVFTDAEQLAFTQRFDGAPTSSTTYDQKVTANGSPLTEIERNLIVDLIKVSNLDENNEVVAANDRRRVSKLGNRMWHTDGSSVDPSGRYSTLSGRIVPSVRADTEFVDTRAAYDALDDDTKLTLKNLRVYHSLVYSRHLLGFSFPKAEEDKLKGAMHPLIRAITGSNRKSLYLGAHASHVIDWPIPEGRLLLQDLTEHATQKDFVYKHIWKQDDFLIWDNRTTLHRARPFDDAKYSRDMRRTMTIDVPRNRVLNEISSSITSY